MYFSFVRIFFMVLGCHIHAFSFEVFPVDTFDDLSLLRFNDQIAVSVFGVAEEAVVVDLHFTLLIAVLDSHFHVLRKTLRFLLGEGSHDGKQHLAFGIHCVDGLFLEEDRDVFIF